jgi:hypothetical protein
VGSEESFYCWIEKFHVPPLLLLPPTSLQMAHQRETHAADELERLRSRLAAVESELRDVRSAAAQHENTAKAAVADADSLAHALDMKDQQTASAERRAESLSQHAAELADQLLSTQRAAAAAQAELDSAAVQVRK